MQEKATKHDKLRLWLVRINRLLACVTLAGLVVGASLFARIYAGSGWHGKDEGMTPIAEQEKLDRYSTSVLIAVQNAPLNTPEAPADMLFIASFNAIFQELTIVGLAPDIPVEVEGAGRLTLAQAYAKGGAGMLTNAVNDAFGLDLQDYACTDTHALAAMIDLLGGISLSLTPDEAGYINRALGAGSVDEAGGALQLTGAQSMVHALNAVTGEAAFGGVTRSLSLIESAVQNLRKTATKDAMLPLLTQVFSNIHTNLDILALRGFGYEVLKADEMTYQSLALPAAGTWRHSLAGGALRVDLEENAGLLREKLYHR